MNKAELTDERLQEMVENLMRQTAAEPADDLYNKMGILRGYLIEYADEQSRDREIKLLEWIDMSYGFAELKSNPNYEFMLKSFQYWLDKSNQEGE